MVSLEHCVCFPVIILKIIRKKKYLVARAKQTKHNKQKKVQLTVNFVHTKKTKERKKKRERNIIVDR